MVTTVVTEVQGWACTGNDSCTRALNVSPMPSGFGCSSTFLAVFSLPEDDTPEPTAMANGESSGEACVLLTTAGGKVKAPLVL